jgi:hypothetical protein
MIEGCRVVSAAVNLGFLDLAAAFSFTKFLIYPHEAEWITFRTQYYSENLGIPGN